MQKGIVLKKGQRYIKHTTDGYIYPYSESLAKQKQMVEFFPFKEDPPAEIAEIEREDEGLEEKLDLMTKREINKFAKLEKSDKDLRLTSKPNMVSQAINKLTWR